jgi:hypothetical protein
MRSDARRRSMQHAPKRFASARCRARATCAATHPEPGGCRRSAGNARGPPFEDHRRELRRELVARRSAIARITAVCLVDAGHGSPPLNACAALSSGRCRCHETLSSMCRATAQFGQLGENPAGGGGVPGSWLTLAHDPTLAVPCAPTPEPQCVRATSGNDVSGGESRCAAGRVGDGGSTSNKRATSLTTFPDRAGPRPTRNRLRSPSSLRKPGRSGSRDVERRRRGRQGARRG